MTTDQNIILRTENLSASFSGNEVVHGINLEFKNLSVNAIIGPSGCGKSTYIRCLNRLHEEVPGASASGKVILQGENIYEPHVDPVLIRRKIGMVFQKPNPFPGMSVYENVVVGLKLGGVKKRTTLDEVVEKSLKGAALWEEVKNKLHAPGTSLSGGQQQRLCIARTLAVEPTVLLMDEPTSALDPVSTSKIEELMVELKKKVSIIIVTHNMQQAARVSDQTSFFLLGNLVESGKTKEVFTQPKDSRTEQYITGRFG